MKKTIILIASTVMALLATAALAASDSQKGIVCKQSYALCTSAPCVPDPDASDKFAICRCTVHEGDSYGATSCKDRAPKTKNNVTQVISTFSFAEFSYKPVMVCESGSPWTNCLDAKCTVNPANPYQAICRCPIVNEGKAVTLGGDCNTKTCKSSYWSGASIPAMNQASTALAKYFNLAKTWTNRVCKGQKDLITP